MKSSTSKLTKNNQEQYSFSETDRQTEMQDMHVNPKQLIAKVPTTGVAGYYLGRRKIARTMH